MKKSEAINAIIEAIEFGDFDTELEEQLNEVCLGICTGFEACTPEECCQYYVCEFR